MKLEVLVALLVASFLTSCDLGNDKAKTTTAINNQPHLLLSSSDRLDIIDVINKYGASNDERDYDVFRSLFYHDVESTFIFTPGFFDGQKVTIKGADDLIKFIKDAESAFAIGGQHLITNPLISREGDLIKVRSNLTWKAYYIDRPGTSVILWGYYETYMKKNDGQWKITKHTLNGLGSK